MKTLYRITVLSLFGLGIMGCSVSENDTANDTTGNITSNADNTVKEFSIPNQGISIRLVDNVEYRGSIAKDYIVVVPLQYYNGELYLFYKHGGTSFRLKTVENMGRLPTIGCHKMYFIPKNGSTTVTFPSSTTHIISFALKGMYTAGVPSILASIPYEEWHGEFGTMQKIVPIYHSRSGGLIYRIEITGFWLYYFFNERFTGETIPSYLLN